MDFWTIKIMSKRVSRSTVGISTREITSKKVRGNNVDLLVSKIIPKKLGNNVDFSISEITIKKVRGNYVEICWNWSSTYRRNINVKLTSIWRGVPVGKGAWIVWIFKWGLGKKEGAMFLRGFETPKHTVSWRSLLLTQISKANNNAWH